MRLLCWSLFETFATFPSPVPSNIIDHERVDRLLNDAERLATRTAEQEHLLSALSALLSSDTSHVLTATASAAISNAALLRIGSPLDASTASAVRAMLRELSTIASAQRQLADSIVVGLSQITARRERVLVVDDGRESRELTSAVLDASGFAVITANNGLDALILAHAVRPAVVLMELTMPVLSGLEAARLLKASDVTRHVKLVAHTARPELLEGQSTNLFVDVLRKPVKPEAIVASIERLIPHVAALRAREHATSDFSLPSTR